MKILLTIILLGIGTQHVFAQDSNLYQTWYLHSYSVDVGPTTYVENIQPPIQVEFVLDENLEFTGIVCNEYGGAFSYDAVDDKLILDMFSPCLCGTCNNPPQSHIDLENEYWGYFQEGQSYEYVVGSADLTISFAPGFDLAYRNTPVTFGVEERQSINLILSPNPVSETLFITSEGTPIEQISIYSISGKRIFSETSSINQIDVSGLKAGLYFAEIATSRGSSTEKFIKQ